MNNIHKFTPTKKPYLYLYSKTSNNNYKYLYIKNFSSPEKYGIITADVSIKDNNNPLFSIARILTNSFYKVILNLKKIINGEIKDISSLILPNSKPLSHFELWSDSIMFYWLDKLSEQIIQYDEIDHTKIFFIELPLMDTTKLNSILQKNKYKYSFEYFSNDTINYNYLDNESLNILKKLNLKQISLHIKSTEEYLKTNKGDLYIILACKIAGKEEKGFFHFPSLFKGIYRRNKEDWRYLLASKNEFPDEKMLKRAKCIIVPGSELSVHDNLEFLRKTEKYFYNLIKEIEEKGKYPHLKILGICFGLEIMMNGFGAKLNKSEWGNKSRYGPEIINLKDEFWELNYVKKSGVKKINLLLLLKHILNKLLNILLKKKTFSKLLEVVNFVNVKYQLITKGKY